MLIDISIPSGDRLLQSDKKFIPFTNLTPFIPLSFKGEGEEIIERGEAPLLPALPFPNK